MHKRLKTTRPRRGWTITVSIEGPNRELIDGLMKFMDWFHEAVERRLPADPIDGPPPTAKRPCGCSGS